ncbi:MAG: hypothetical protein E7107_03690 [Prevotella sp.]|nr:hypothetical protein [Prevotella sp.]
MKKDTPHIYLYGLLSNEDHNQPIEKVSYSKSFQNTEKEPMREIILKTSISRVEKIKNKP